MTTLATRPNKVRRPHCDPTILDLARQELRDAAESLRRAQSRTSEAHAAFPKFRGKGRDAVEGLALRAVLTELYAEKTIAEVLLIAWGFTSDFHSAADRVPTPPWEPVGAFLEGIAIWIEPATDDGQIDYDASNATVHIESTLLDCPFCPMLNLR